MVQDKLEVDEAPLPEIKNAIWMNEEHNVLDFMINHKEYGWIPYTTSASDEGIGKQIWDIRDTLDIADYVPPPLHSLEELREQKLNELNSKASIYENSKCDEMFVVSSLGFSVNADRRSQQNIEGLIKILGDETTMFKDYDNEFHELGVKDFEILLMECIQNGLNLYTQKFKMQQELSQLETVEDINNYEIKFEMLKF